TGTPQPQSQPTPAVTVINNPINGELSSLPTDTPSEQYEFLLVKVEDYEVFHGQ
ncbi:44130_t:CDS:2, partial [Gigaspora margarita]